MRLLNVRTKKMEIFLDEKAFPQYAILSHTWGREEVSLKDWETLEKAEREKMAGFKKIKYARRQAAKDGFDWVWVDTCCIDKTSSAELSEAINSMYNWYQRAARCYAYLADVSFALWNDESRTRALSQSRWFTRGWTLQELLAPRNVVFYSGEWAKLGSKDTMWHAVSEITDIDEDFLRGRPLEEASISKRMSWAAKRETSRPEDMAYCLLGLFDINMPLLYGEGGRKAFLRLQHEIMGQYPLDHTLFAWGTLVDRSSLEELSLAAATGKEPLRWRPPTPDETPLGLLAETPKDFELCGSFAPLPTVAESFYGGVSGASPPVMFGQGIRLELPYGVGFPTVQYWEKPEVAQLRELACFILLCSRWGFSSLPCIGIPMIRVNIDRYVRTRKLVELPWPDQVWKAPRSYLTIDNRPIATPSISHGALVFRNFTSPGTISSESVMHDVNLRTNDDFGIFEPDGPGLGRWLVRWLVRYFKWKADPDDQLERGFALRFWRDEPETGEWPVHVDLTPVHFGETRDQVQSNGTTWLSYQQITTRSPLSLHHKSMVAPLDSWECRVGPLPPVWVQVQRLPLGGDGGFIDAIDYSIARDEITSENIDIFP